MKSRKTIGIVISILTAALGLLSQKAYAALICAKGGIPAAEIVIPAQTQITETGGSALISIPREGLKIDPTKQTALKGLFVRHFVPAKKEGTAPVKVAVLSSGVRHKEESFCEIKLLK